MHISIPGSPESDRTNFSTTKREAERLIANSGVAHTILRCGLDQVHVRLEIRVAA